MIVRAAGPSELDTVLSEVSHDDQVSSLWREPCGIPRRFVYKGLVK